MAAPTAKELLALAVEQVKDDVQPGQKPAAALARRIGLPYPRVYKWFKPGNGLNYDGAMAILEAFGWLNIPADAHEQAGLPPDHLQEIAATLREILAQQRRILRKLTVQPAPQDAPGEVPPKRRKK